MSGSSEITRLSRLDRYLPVWIGLATIAGPSTGVPRPGTGRVLSRGRGRRNLSTDRLWSADYVPVLVNVRYENRLNTIISGHRFLSSHLRSSPVRGRSGAST